MVIYLEGEHGIRIAYNEGDAVLHEKDGYKRIDYEKRCRDLHKKVNRKPRTKKAVVVETETDD